MRLLSKKEFERYLDKVFDEVLMYDARFSAVSRQEFEIGILLSKAACSLFRRYGYIPHTITEDPFNCSSYLFGHRIAFLNSDIIPNEWGDELLVKPFIVCNSIGVFPTESEVGDYVLFNGRLVQVIHIGYTNGRRTFQIEDIEVEISDRYYMSSDEKAEALSERMKYLRKRKENQDAWADNVDTSAISEYLSTLTVI